MAERIRGITVELGADTTGISKALSGINKDLKSTQSQLKDVEKLLKLDPTNVELLRQKQKLLNDAVEESKEKVKALREAEKQLKDSGVDENSDQFMALKREIIATEAAMQSYQEQAEKGSEATEESTKKNEKAEKGLISLSSAFAAVAAAAVAAGTAMVSASVSAAKYADDLLTTSVITGISTDKLQELAYASELVDVSLDTLTGTMSKNIRSMKQAADGSETYAETYEALGVAVTDVNGNLRDGETVYWEVIDALGQIQNETERDSLAMNILGKSAQDLNPLIKAGSDRLEELAEAARESGYVLSGDTLNSFGEFDDSLQYLNNSATAAKNAIGALLLPELKNLADSGTEYLDEFTAKISGEDGNIFTAIVDMISENLPTVVENLANLAIKILDGLAEKLPDILPKLVESLCEIIEMMTQPEMIRKITLSVIKVAWAVIKSVLLAFPDMISTALSSTWNTTAGVSLPMMANGGVLSNGSAIVGERGPELLTNVGGKSVVTPLSGDTGGISSETVVNVNFNGSLSQLAAVLQPYITAETVRKGGTFA